MQVRTINNIEYKFFYNKQLKDKTKETASLNKKVASYSGENVRANYIPAFKSMIQERRKHNFLSCIAPIKVNGASLSHQIKDDSILDDEDFDSVSWGNFLTIFNNKAENEEKTYLEKFLSKNSLQELLYSPDFEPEDVFGVILEVKNSTNSFSSKNLFEMINFISDVDSSKYDAIERTKALSYFVNLKDSNGEQIFKPINPRQSLISTYEYLLGVDPASTEASSIEMLINLVVDGVVDKNIFEFLPKDGKISEPVVQDIDKLYNAYVDGIEPIDAFIPHFKTKEEAEKSLKVGDVFTFDGVENCHIMLEDNASSIPLGFDKKTYFNLFPPIKRFATTQNDIGNCWELSTLRALYSTPETRYAVLRLFEQDGENINIHFDKGYSGEISYPNGKIPEEEDTDSYSNGAEGFRLLENADGRELQAEKIRMCTLHYEYLKKKGDERAEQKLSELNKMLEQGSNSVNIDYDYRTDDWELQEYKKTDSNLYYTPEARNRDGGNPFELLFRLGFTNTDELMPNEEEVEDLMKTNFEDNIIFWSSKRNLPIDAKLVDSHTYFISSANYDEKGNIKDYNIVNPWGMVEQTFSLEELKQYGASFTYSKKDGYK